MRDIIFYYNMTPEPVRIIFWLMVGIFLGKIY